jgi:hypothetical protein
MDGAEGRQPRTGGRRQSAMPWLPLAVGISAAIPIVPAAVVWGGWGGNLALRSIWILLIAGAFCWSMVRRQHLPQAGHVDDFGSSEGSVLFLRSFRSERVPFSQSDAHARRRVPYRQLAFLWSDPNDEFPSFERYLGPALSERIGPVIGLGAPFDRLPPRGRSCATTPPMTIGRRRSSSSCLR